MLTITAIAVILAYLRGMLSLRKLILLAGSAGNSKNTAIAVSFLFLSQDY
mgnify:CR=1 FL=1